LNALQKLHLKGDSNLKELGGLRAKEGRVSIGPKEEKKNERTKEERRNKKKR
jgi:hypothetical protein